MKYILITIVLLFSTFAFSQNVDLLEVKNDGTVIQWEFQALVDYASRNPDKVLESTWWQTSGKFNIENIIIQYPLLNDSYYLVDSKNEGSLLEFKNDNRTFKGDKSGTFYFSSNIEFLFLLVDGQEIKFERSGAAWKSDKYELINEFDFVIEEEEEEEPSQPIIDFESEFKGLKGEIPLPGEDEKKAYTAKEIAKRYYKTKVNDTGFSTEMIYLKLGGTGNTTEKKMSEYIFEQINR